MRILLLHQYFHEKEVIGGSRFNEMTDVWAAQGHEITVLAGMIHYGVTSKKPEKYKGKLLVKEQHAENIEVIRCHVSESYNKSFLGRFWGYLSFVFYSIIGGIFKANGKYDLMLVTSPPLFVGITGYILSRWKRIPLVFEIRDLWPESAIDTGVLKNKTIIKFAYWFESFIYRKSALINVLTPAFRKKLIENKNVPEDKIIFIPNAADFNISDKLLNTFDVEAFRKEKNFGEELNIIYVGAHGVANHLIQVLDVAELTKGEPIVYWLVGGGMQKVMLMDEAKKRGLDNVRFGGPVPKVEIMKYILASDVGTSILKKVDTFKTIYSNKTFDYMSCKKPIIMAIDGVSRKLINDADCGLYAEPENAEAFAEQARKYLADKQLQKDHGENGYAFAKENFHRTVLAKKYLSHLMTVAGIKELETESTNV